MKAVWLNRECIGIQSKYLFSVERIKGLTIEESRIDNFCFYKNTVLKP